MKKTLFVAVLAIAICAFAASAFAVENATTGNFQAWDGAHAGNGNGTPHMGFSTTSEKCSVCHSVHNAAAAAAADGNVLLRANRNDACTTCHITGAVSGNKPYGAVAANYTGDVNYNHASAYGAWAWYGGCTSCHSVHGANTFVGGFGNDTFILRNTGGADPDAPAIADAATEITSFCSQCHAYVNAGYDVAAGGDSNHIMTAAIAAYAGEGANAVGQPVAFTSSANCQSCHDANSAVNGNSFPHYMPNTARFLMGAADAGAAKAVIGAESSVDGACIKCHLDGAGAGVGLTF